MMCLSKSVGVVVKPGHDDGLQKASTGLLTVRDDEVLERSPEETRKEWFIAILG